MRNMGKHTILIVDDERNNIDALTFILRPKYTVLIAKDGETAIDLARSKKPDLILLDIVMPGISGFETLVKLKSLDMTQRIPVIFITGRDNPEDEKKGLSLGAVDYITKPFNDFVVEARVRTHLQIVEYIHTIENLCRMDALTNIPNRRFFDDQLSMEWERAIRDKTRISILMIDVDRFKNYNDTYGHPQGDTLLRMIAALFEKELNRPADFVARWGGEEFSVLLPDTDINGAMEVAERMRANVECAVIPCVNGNKTKITISIGVNSEAPVTGCLAEDFISRADKALYAAKESGRNAVKAYDFSC